jgi:hypothetical protein
MILSVNDRLPTLAELITYLQVDPVGNPCR